jgi:hypothetical protein
MSHDPKIVQGNHIVLDLDNKPVPKISEVQAKKVVQGTGNKSPQKPQQEGILD